MRETEESSKWVLSALPDLGDFSAEFRAYCEGQGLGEASIFALELSLEELIVNTFTHGYKDRAGGTITVEVKDTGPELKVSVQDKAPPFDLVRGAPLPRLGGRDPEPEPGAEPESGAKPASGQKEEKVGGLGIHLVKSLNDRVEYYGSQDGNLVVIIKSKT